MNLFNLLKVNKEVVCVKRNLLLEKSFPTCGENRKELLKTYK